MRISIILLVYFILNLSAYSRVCTEKDFIDNTIHECQLSGAGVSGASNFNTSKNMYEEYEEDGDKRSEYDDVWPYDAKLCYVNQIYGPTFKSYNPFDDYHYFRFVTVYNVKKIKNRAPFPIFREECHDDSWRMGSFNKKITTKVAVTSKIDLKALGISVEGSLEYSIEFDRGVRATYGVVADHIPYIYTEIWEGQTYLQTFNKNTNEVKLSKFVYPFKMENVNPIFVVERKVLQVFSKCPLNY